MTSRKAPIKRSLFGNSRSVRSYEKNIAGPLPVINVDFASHRKSMQDKKEDRESLLITKMGNSSAKKKPLSFLASLANGSLSTDNDLTRA